MKSRKYDPLIALFLLVAVSVSCVVFVEGGFGIETFDQVNGTNVSAPNIGINGWWDPEGTSDWTGDVTQFSTTTGSDGRAYINDGRAPAVWDFFWRTGPCAVTFQRQVKLWANPSSYTPLICIARRGFFFNILPETINLQAPPATFALSGEGGIDASHGMPLVEFYDSDNGSLVALTQASSVSPDGTSLEAPTPDLSACYNRGYGVLVSNAMADGSWEPIGSAGVDITGASDPPQGGCQHDGYCAEWDDVNCVCLRY